MDTVADLETALWHYCRPLPEDQREAFCAAAQDALSRLTDPGPGATYRMLRELLCEFFVPLPGDFSAGGAHRKRRFSKLASEPPIAPRRDLTRRLAR